MDEITTRLKTKSYRKLFALLLLIPFSVSAQLLEQHHEKYWLRPSTAGVDDSLRPVSFIGNYSVLDLDQQEYQEQLKGIAGEHSGTLFLVLKNQGDLSTETPLLHLGRFVVYTDKVLLDGKELLIDTINAKAFILRLNFQARPNQLYMPPRVRVREGVQVSEIIFYDHMLEPEQRRIVESYLAMKFSVNITENTNADLRDYLDIFKDKAWSSRLDGLYNQEVLALGRLDTIGFYQSQTYSSDAQSISLSLQSEAQAGTMPELDLEDGSLLILSRKEHEATGQDCGSSPEVNTWKLRLIKWQSKEPTLYLTIDTLLDSTQQPLLTDGSKTIPVKTSELAGYTQLAIPLNKIEASGDLYLTLGSPNQECDPLAEVLIRDCDPMDSTANQVYLQVEREALPATLNLVNLETKEALQTDLNDPATLIGPLGAGQYQLSLSSEHHILSDKVFHLGNCWNDLLASKNGNTINSFNNGDEDSPWQVSTLPGNGPSELDEENLGAYLKSLGIDPNATDQEFSKGIEVYPNPGSRFDPVSFRLIGLSGIPFTIQIYDSKGNLMVQREFTPSGEVAEFRHRFRVDGSYFIRFISAQHSETKHLRIKSNL